MTSAARNTITLFRKFVYEMSETAKRIIGTFIEDKKPAAPTLAWMQEELRTGRLRASLKRFAQAQEEILDPNLVQVDRLTDSAVYGRLPCSVCDRENRSPFRYDVEFELNPLTGRVLRRS